MTAPCREAFEKWCKTNLDHSAKIPEDVKGFIIDGIWSGWQAAWNSRPAVPVELCKWTKIDVEYSDYDTGCGNAFFLSTDEFFLKFCPWCGKPIDKNDRVLPTPSHESDDCQKPGMGN